MIYTFPRAYEIACEAHKDDKRWNGDPYMTHVDAVIEGVYVHPYHILSTFVKDGLQTIAALHDVVEDHGDIWPLSRIEEELELVGVCGSQLNNIISGIDAITKRVGESYTDFIIRVSLHEWAKIVKRADLTHNLSDLKKGSRRDKYELALYILR